MSAYAAACHRALGRWTKPRAARSRATARALFHADVRLRPDVWLSVVYATSALVALWGLLLGGLLVVVAKPPLAVAIALPLGLALVLGGAAVAGASLWLRNAGVERGKDIDDGLPHALNYMLALANAGLPPREMFRSLARASAFGAMAREAERIHRDLALFGLDVLEALRLAQERTPSKRFAEFLQGAISSFQSGVELESYLRNKCRQYAHEAAEQQREAVETMGVMAEAFLVVAVAAPLFLLILLTVMAIDRGESVIALGLALALVFIPMTQLIIGTMIKSLNPRVWT